jgi:hypothetical protein
MAARPRKDAPVSGEPPPHVASAAKRYDAIRTAQAQALKDGRVLPAPPTPVHVAVAVDPASMSVSQRWALMRSSDQSKMRPWRDPRSAG